MQLIFDKMKKGENISEFNDVLRGGKGDKKQHENLQKIDPALPLPLPVSSSKSK